MDNSNLLQQYKDRVLFLEELLKQEELLQKAVYVYGYVIDAIKNSKNIDDLVNRTQGCWSVITHPCCVTAIFANLNNNWIKYGKQKFKIIAWICDTKLSPAKINNILNKQFSQFEKLELTADSVNALSNDISKIVSTISAIAEEKRKQLEAQQAIQDQEEAETEELEVDDEVKELTDDERKEVLRKTWGEKLSPVIASIMSSYDGLYKSGYGLEAPSGVLTNIGTVKSTSDGKRSFSGDRATDVEVFNALESCLGDNFKYYANEGDEPDINVISKSKYPITYVDMHLKFMFGHIRYCTGAHSLKKYLTKHNIILPSEQREGKKGKLNPSEVKVIQYGDIRNWIKETLEDYFYKAYIDFGVTDDLTQDNIEMTNRINTIMSKSLKNVIAVVDRKKGVNTKIRICTDTPINSQAVIETLTSALNIGTASTVLIKQVGEYTQGVLELDIIYNERVHSQDSLFAYQVLDILDAQGIKPSWDNVILGKKDDGTIMTYNFKNKKSPTYALYAASRSGKGVMTLNLLASALADGCKLFYIDGKPDMACVIADIAWKNGLDAMAYNGVAGKGAEMLENRGNCIRKENPFASSSEIPKDLFVSDAEVQKFMLITTYMRGIELMCAAAADRASKNNSMSNNDWVVVVVDECEQAAIAEKDVLQCMDRAEAERKAAKGPDGKKIDLTQDETYKFIQNYRRWLTLIDSNFKTCVTSTFGFANMTVFFVWQSTMFPEKYKTVSTLAKIVAGASGNIVKIVGRGAAVTNGSTSYGTPNSLKQAKWYDERFSGEKGGFFAIGGNVNSDEMKVFRPFNVYSDADHKELILENAKALGLTEDDLKGSQLNDDGSVIPEVGFEGYVNSLLKRYNLNAATQINAGWVYADNFVREVGLAEGINQFMYNCHQFSAGGRSDTVEMPNINKGMSADGIVNEEDEAEDEEIHFGNELIDEVVQNGTKEKSKYAQEMLDKLDNKKKPIPTKVLTTKRLLDMGEDFMSEYHKRIASRAYLSFNTFNFADRTPNSNNGLRVICILLSNLAGLSQNGIVEYNMVVGNILDKLNGSNKGRVAAALGYFESVCNGSIPYDYMPHSQDMAKLQQIGLSMFESAAQAQEDMGEVNPIENMTSNMIPNQQSSEGFIDTGFEDEEFEDTQDFDSMDIPLNIFENQEASEEYISNTGRGNGNGSVMYDTPNTKSAFGKTDDGRTFIMTRGTSDVGLIKPNMYVRTMVPNYTAAERFKKRLFENRYGTSYEFKKRWDYLLDCVISSFPSASMITRITLLDSTVSVNNKVVDVASILDDDFGIMLEDIINFKRMFKRIPMIKELLLDDTTFEVLVEEYGATPQQLWNVFAQNRALQRISIVKAGTKNVTAITRDTFNKAANEVADRASEAKFRSDVEKMMAAKNPSLDKKSAGYKNRIWEGTKTRSSQAWKNAYNNMAGSKVSLAKSLGWSVYAGAIIGVGGVLSIGGRVKSLITGRR